MIRRKMRLFDQHRDYDLPYMADLHAYVEVDRIATNSRPKYRHYCKLHFSNGDMWELKKSFTQRSKRCRAFEGVSEFIKQYSGEQSIIFVTSCPLNLFHSYEIKSDYLGWSNISATIREALRIRRHMFGL